MSSELKAKAMANAAKIKEEEGDDVVEGKSPEDHPTPINEVTEPTVKPEQTKALDNAIDKAFVTVSKLKKELRRIPKRNGTGFAHGTQGRGAADGWNSCLQEIEKILVKY